MKNDLLKKVLTEHKLRVDPKYDHDVVSGGLNDFWNVLEVLKDCPQFMNSYNKALTQGFLSGNYSDSHALGGDPEDLDKRRTGLFDMKLFEETRANLEESALFKEVLPDTVFTAQTRRRKLSPYDGDWDLDKKWEHAPFSHAVRQSSEVKRVEIRCYMSVLASVSADNYNKYGAICWAICNVLERMGIQVKVTGIYAAKDSFKLHIDGCTMQRGSHVEICLKEYTEYVAPSLLAGTFHSVFFRRGVFAMRCVVADLYGEDISYGLGSSVQIETPIEYKKGVVTVAPDVRTTSYGDIAKILLKAVSEGK